jgi:hypothetical protein
MVRTTCFSNHTDCHNHEYPVRAEYRCKLCGEKWCGGCINVACLGGMIVELCGNENCHGEVEAIVEKEEYEEMEAGLADEEEKAKAEQDQAEDDAAPYMDTDNGLQTEV